MPRAVMNWPSRTTKLSESSPPPSVTSFWKLGKAVASRPFRSPLWASMEGAAQIAPRSFPSRAQKSMSSWTFGDFSRFRVPGSPPGRITQSRPSAVVSDISRSAVMGTPLEELTVLPVTPTVLTSTFARRSTSTGAMASTSSKPSAKSTYTINIAPS